MMLLKIEKVGEGLHPSETLVAIKTKHGAEELAVDSQALRNGTLPVGWPVGRSADYLLVELPRPTGSGAKRVWVQKDELVPDKTARKTA
jgi:hypothetical protein